ncbi:MAG: LrgB family protein [Oscillospiraceae bacterium]|nr:LrgB family protein [Oscillospiraceae bacterium]
MIDFLASSAYFGLALTLGMFFLARVINKKAEREIFNPLLFATVTICLLLLFLSIPYETYHRGAQHIDILLTPATICLAIPLYRQYTLLKENFRAVLAGCISGVVAHMLGCILLLVVLQLDSAAFATILPKSITTAIGKSLSEEMGGYSAITMATIMLTGQFGAVAAPALLKLFHIHDPLAQGLAIGTASHAAGTSRAVQLGEIQGASSSLAIVVTGLLTVFIAPLIMKLA